MPYYSVGSEPERLKSKLKSFFEQLDSFYPDKVVVGLHNKHKKLGERLTKLYREAGYESGNAMLEAYGYSCEKTKRSKKTDEDKAKEKAELIDELKRRINGDIRFKTIASIMEAFPDLGKAIVNTHLTRQDLINAKLITTSDDQLEQLKAIIGKHKNKLPIYSVDDIEKNYPETAELMDQLKNVKNIKNLLITNGILSKKPVKKKAIEKNVTTGTERSGYGDMAYEIPYEYGISTSKFLAKREKVFPKGKLGHALKLIKEILDEIGVKPNEGMVSEEMFDSELLRKMQFAAAEAGYISAKRLLMAYGYEVSNKRSQLTAMVKIIDDEKKSSTQKSEDDIRVEYASLLPVTTEIIDYSGKTFVLSGYFSDNYYDKLNEIIPKKGGVIRSSISGKTDYIVIYGVNSLTRKFEEAVSQKDNKNHVISLVFFEDIAVSLGIRLDQHDKRNFDKFKKNYPDYASLYSNANLEFGTAELTGEYDEN